MTGNPISAETHDTDRPSSIGAFDPDSTMPAPCRYCGAPAVLCDTRMIWPRVVPAKPLWVCRSYPACDAYVRCHDGSTRPMGSLAGPRLRKLRGSAHKAFDPLWQEGGKVINRTMAYLAASQVMGIDDLHIGCMDEDQCLHFLASIEKIEDALTAFAEELLNPRKVWSEPELDVVEAIFSDDYGQTWLPRVPLSTLTKGGPVAQAAVAGGLVRIEDAGQGGWAFLTDRGRRILNRGLA